MSTPDFFTVFATLGKDPAPEKLNAAIDCMSHPRHAISLAIRRASLRKDESVMRRFCDKAASIAEKFTSGDALELRDNLGKDPTDIEQALINEVQKKARKPELIGSSH